MLYKTFYLVLFLSFEEKTLTLNEKSFEDKILVKISFPCEFVASYGNKNVGIKFIVHDTFLE